MTRKDYIVIASALRDAYQKEEMDNKYAPEAEPCVSPKFYPRRKWHVSPCATAGRV
ncbi:MAG: hypothetical protein WA603_24175 [Candidatus Acidiferrales bacterium]